MYYTAFPATTVAGGFQPAKGSLYPYVKSTRIYVCPSDESGQKSGLSYAINGCALSTKSKDMKNGVRPGKLLSAFPNPSQWMLFSSEADAAGNPPVSTNDGYYNWQTDTLSERHFGGEN